MTRILSLALAASIAFALSGLPVAMAAPVSAADLAGKKICWNSGTEATFGPGGKYSSNTVGVGTWKVTSNGVSIRTSTTNGYNDIQKEPDGTFSLRKAGRGGLAMIFTGKVC